MENVLKMTNLYVATLRQMYAIHQFSHWTTQGPAFYANHLVFERLYKSAAEDADMAAEKMLGVFGPEGLDYVAQSDFMNKIALRFADLSKTPVEMSLKIEKQFLAYSKEFHDYLDKEGLLTIGLSDMIASIASKREESCYLLQQILNK